MKNEFEEFSMAFKEFGRVVIEELKLIELLKWMEEKIGNFRNSTND